MDWPLLLSLRLPFKGCLGWGSGFSDYGAKKVSLHTEIIHHFIICLNLKHGLLTNFLTTHIHTVQKTKPFNFTSPTECII